MIYILTKFDALIAGLLILKNKEAAFSSDTLQKVYALFQETSDEAEQLRYCLMKEVLSIRKEKKLTVFVHNFQTACIVVADNMYMQALDLESWSLEPPLLKDLLNRHHTIMHKIDELLRFIELHFPKHFNVFQPLPHYYYIRCRQQVLRQLRALKPLLYKRFNNRELVNIALAPVVKFLQPLSHKDLCFHDIIYLNELFVHLKHCMEQPNEPDWMGGLEICLWKMNLNSAIFIAYMQRILSAQIENTWDENAKIKKWMQLEKELRSIIIQTDRAMLPHKESLETVIGRYIADELLQLQTAALANQTQPVKASDHKVFHFNLTVSQVAILLRLLVEAGFLKAYNQTEFLKNAAMVIKTDKTAIISAESLRNKYYAPEKNQMLSVKDMLFNLIKQMKRLE